MFRVYIYLRHGGTCTVTWFPSDALLPCPPFPPGSPLPSPLPHQQLTFDGSCVSCRLGVFRSRRAQKGAGTTCLPAPSSPSPAQDAGCFPWVACSVSFAWRAPRFTSWPPGFSLKLPPVSYERSWTPSGSPSSLCRACMPTGLLRSDGVGSALTKPHALAEKHMYPNREINALARSKPST